jgi:hypothetical protein
MAETSRSNMKIRILTLAALFAATMYGQSATPISYPNNSFISYIMMEAQAIPATPTVITTRKLIFGGGWISCSTAQTVTMTDGNAKNIMPAVALAANTTYGLAVIAGTYVSGGFSISASGAGCLYQAYWRQ